MRKGFNFAAVAGAVAMAVSGVAGAAGHPAFGNYSYDGTSKAITLNGCAAISCDVIAQGDGFVQYMAKNAAGDTFIGTIVHDANGENVFKDESFIKMQLSTGGAAQDDINGGIAAQQSIVENSADGTQFVSTVDLTTGLFSPTGTTAKDPTTIKIKQTLGNQGGTDTVNVGDDFQTDFMYQARTDETGQRTGFMMEIDQIAGLATTTDNSTVNDVQAFTYREVAGQDLETPTGSLSVAGGTLGFKAGQDIKAVWLGQDVNIGAGTSTGLGGSFSYLSYENKGVTTGGVVDKTDAAVISDFDLAGSTSPVDYWGAGTASPFNLSFDNGTTTGVPTTSNPSGTAN